jgi:hypothetical protein
MATFRVDRRVVAAAAVLVLAHGVPAASTAAPAPSAIAPGADVDAALFPPELPPGSPAPKPAPPAKWNAPQTLEIEWGVGDGPPAAVHGRLEAWWAHIVKMEPLAEGNGTTVAGENRWKEDLAARKDGSRRGLRLTFMDTTGPVAIFSLYTGAGNLGVGFQDVLREPVLIPSVGFYVTKPGSIGVTAHREALAAKKLTTARRKVLAAPEESYAGAMSRVFGENVKKLPEFPKAPYEPLMQIDVPEKGLVDQWRIGAWHLKRWCRKMEDGTYQVSIWRFRFREMWDRPGERKDDQTTFEKGFATCIGQESHEIIRALGVLGGHDDVARGGLDHWIRSEVKIKGNNFGTRFADFDGILMGYNPHGRSPDYDMKHPTGHGLIMEAAAHHDRMTGDKDWFLNSVPRLKKACEWILRQRKAWAPELPKDAWGYGLQPPINFGDYGGAAQFYLVNARYWKGLADVARIMSELKVEGAEDLLKQAGDYRQDIRAAVEKSSARTPVVRVGDGTYRRFVPATPYSRSTRVGGNDSLMGFACLADRDDGVYAPDDPLVRDVVDVLEEALAGSGGITGQVGYEAHPRIALLNDDVPLFLRSLYREYAVLIRPWELEADTPRRRNGPETIAGPAAYEFFEHPGRWAVDKTFEEAVFLQRVRNMLVIELGQNLWLARATPRAWLEQGKKIGLKNAPTFYGTVAYEILSDVDRGRITATVELPSRNAPAGVILRLRHPKAAPIQGVTVNGKEWKDFDKGRETIRLHGLAGKVQVTAAY